MRTKSFIVLLLFYLPILSQINPSVEINYGITELQLKNIPTETPGFNNGYTYQLSVGNEFNLNYKNFFLGTSLFYRGSTNSLNLDWADDISSDIRDDFEFNTKLIGINLNLQKKILFNESNISIKPKYGINIGYFLNQNLINPGYNSGVSLNYENLNLNEYSNDVKILDNIYLSNLIGIGVCYSIKDIDINLIPSIEYQINYIFRNKQYDESYLNFNLGLNVKYTIK